MPFTASATVNQRLQAGQEATPGAGGAAGKTLASLMFEFAPENTVHEFKTQGRRHTQLVEPEQTWGSWSLTGDAEYSEIPYLIEGMFGTVAPVLTGATTNTRSYVALLAGALSPKTLVCQWGDANNVNIAPYVLPHDLGIKHDREGAVTVTGAGINQPFSTGGAFTATPTEQPLQPILASQTNYYLDTTGAGIGATQVTDEVLDSAWDYKGLYGPRWASNRAYPSFASHVDLKPTATAQLTLAEGTLARSIVIGGLSFLRIEDVGTVIEAANHWSLVVDLAVRCTKIGKFSDKKGVYMRQFDFTIVEDPTWAAALKISSVTSMATL